jgi:hypothetical protein
LYHVARSQQYQDDIEEEESQKQRPRTADGGHGVDGGQDEPSPAVYAESVVERGKDISMCVRICYSWVRQKRLWIVDMR